MAQLPPDLRHAGIYVTPRQLGYDRSLTEAEVLERLGRLSVYDCMGMVGRLSAAIHVDPQWMKPASQLRLVDWLAKQRDPDLHMRLQRVVRRGLVAVCEQQLVHLARLAIVHADPRPPEGFDSARAQAFLDCLFRGIPDLLQASDVDLRDPRQRLSWTLRQCGISQSHERLPLWSTYFEVFRRIWPELSEPHVPDADEAFARYAGLSIEQFMTTGFVLAAGYGGETVGSGSPSPSIRPDEFLSSPFLEDGSWQAFLRVAAAPLDNLRERILDEEQRWGATTYGALAFEKTPLLRGPNDECYLIDAAALDRRSTYGILHLLAEGSASEGRDREHFTAPFGAAFQAWVEACLRRGLSHASEPPLMIVDEDYGTKRLPRRTPDVVLRYPRALVLIEVVAGPLQAQTVTRGDLDAFDRDFKKLVWKKADQLSRRGTEILNGDALRIGLDPEGIGAVRPVIVTATPFPHRPEIGREVRRRLKQEGVFKDRRFRPIAIISAEELAAAEGAMEEGSSFLDLLRGWKSTAAVGDHSFKNFLIDREADKRRKPGQYHIEMFDEACDAMIGHAFPDGLPPRPA